MTDKGGDKKNAVTYFEMDTQTIYNKKVYYVSSGIRKSKIVKKHNKTSEKQGIVCKIII